LWRGGFGWEWVDTAESNVGRRLGPRRFGGVMGDMADQTTNDGIEVLASDLPDPVEECIRLEQRIAELEAENERLVDMVEHLLQWGGPGREDRDHVEGWAWTARDARMFLRARLEE
jgi:hypothetical protein